MGNAGMDDDNGDSRCAGLRQSSEIVSRWPFTKMTKNLVAHLVTSYGPS